MWLQIGAVVFFACVAIAEAASLKSPTFGLQMGWIIFALAAATMAFEAWRSWRKINTGTKKSYKLACEGRN